MRSTARLMKPFVMPGQIVVNVAKGIEDKTLMTMCEILEDELPQADVAILSGPSHAEEISKGMLTTVVVGGRTEKTAVFIQDVFMANHFRVYVSPDRIGIEIGGKMESFFGLSGIGDLIVTCTSTHSRNHNCGYLLGKGKTLEEAKKGIRQEIEGVNCARAAMALANKHHVNMPIVEQINAVLFEGKSTDEALEELILRERAIEYQSLKW